MAIIKLVVVALICMKSFFQILYPSIEILIEFHFQLLQYFSFITPKYNKPLRKQLFPYFVFYFSGKTRSLAT